MFWGITPALDLQEELVGSTTTEVLNILIVGGADCRHALKTLAQRYRHKKIQINFYIMEAVIETIAKQLLLLNVALQPEEDLGLVQKTRIFMELYGNTLVRPAVAKYLKVSAEDLIRMITNEEYMKKAMPFVDLNMKYKERDYLENVLKFWCSSDEFNICEVWDKNLRKNLGIRYDTRLGVFDWDLHMRLHTVGAHQLCNQEYRHWRLTGVAFTWIESEVSKPNRTLVCGVIPNGENFVHYGFLGDTQTGPFIAYGLNCEDAEFLKRSNGQNSHRATDVTQRNLQQMFHELATGEAYEHQQTTDLKLGATHFQQSDVRVVDVGAIHVNKKKYRKCKTLENARIIITSIDKLKMMKHKENVQNFFDVVYFGSTYLKYFESETIEWIAAPKSVLIIENQIFVPSHREKQLEEFGKSLTDSVRPLKSAVGLPFDVQKDLYAKFLLKDS